MTFLSRGKKQELNCILLLISGLQTASWKRKGLVQWHFLLPKKRLSETYTERNRIQLPGQMKSLLWCIWKEWDKSHRNQKYSLLYPWTPFIHCVFLFFGQAEESGWPLWPLLYIEWNLGQMYIIKFSYHLFSWPSNIIKFSYYLF